MGTDKGGLGRVKRGRRKGNTRVCVELDNASYLRQLDSFPVGNSEETCKVCFIIICLRHEIYPVTSDSH